MLETHWGGRFRRNLGGARRDLNRRVALAISAMLIVGALMAPSWPHRQPGFFVSARSAQQATTYLVLFVLDGARPDYFSVPGTPNLQALIRRGTQYSNAWAGILESETPSGHASIGTGSEPRNDGVPSFSWATSDNIPVSLFNPDVIRQGALESLLAQAHVPSIASLVHKSDPHAKVVALSGHKYYAADAMGGPNADIIMYYAGTSNGQFVPTFIPGHGPPPSVLASPALNARSTNLPLGTEDYLTIKLAVRTFKTIHQQATLINVPEFDWPLGHVYGGDRNPAAVRTLMQSFDRDLGMLEKAYRKAGVLDRTVFVFTADHGLAPIYYRVPKESIERAVLAAGTSIVADTFHTGDFIWVRDKSKAAAAAWRVAALRNPYIQSVYYKRWAPKVGFSYVRSTGGLPLSVPGVEQANQYLLRSFGGPNGPDVAVLHAEDAASEPGGQANWQGDHGGSAWESEHIPLVFSGPGFRQGYVSQQPARLIDIAPTALWALNIPATGMHGVALVDSRTSSPQWAQTRENGRGAALRPIVSALQAESRLELAAHR